MLDYTEFFPGNDGAANAAALQKAVDRGGEIRIEKPGIYDLADTIIIGSNTSLVFSQGVTIRRQNNPESNGNAFINRGAFTGTPDRNIFITGLELLVNDVESTPASEECSKTVLGLRGHLAFLYIENLKLENIRVTGLCHKDYGIQICNFRNVIVETIYIEGNKDGIHFGPGTGFILRNGTFRTGDDPIALNADDYAVSNPTLGTIENGLIENCRDLYEDKNEGYFVRILSGSWVDWYEGMEVQHSDSVIYNGNLYRVVMSPNFEKYISLNPPDFESGFRTIDGIRWAKAGYEKVYSSSVRDITFRNIYCEKSRETVVSFSVEQNEYRRGYYEGSDFPSNGDFVFDNIQVTAEIKYPVQVATSVDSITIRNSKFSDGRLLITNRNQANLECSPLHLHLENNDFDADRIEVVGREVTID